MQNIFSFQKVTNLITQFQKIMTTIYNIARAHAKDKFFLFKSFCDF